MRAKRQADRFLGLESFMGETAAAKISVREYAENNIVSADIFRRLSLPNVQDEPRPLGAVGSGAWLGSVFLREKVIVCNSLRPNFFFPDSSFQCHCTADS